jgi:hypothetical protein
MALFFALQAATIALTASGAHARCTELTDHNGAPYPDNRWDSRASYHQTPQSFWPTYSGETHARDIFYVTVQGLKSMLRHYTPNDWDKGTITRRLAGTEQNPVMTLDIDLRFWVGPIPIDVDAMIPVGMSSCAIRMSDSSNEGRRILFDMRRATGRFEGIIDAMRIDFRVEDDPGRRGHIVVTSRVGILKGRSYGATGSDDAAELMRQQIWPIMHAMRSRYTEVHRRAEEREYRQHSAIATAEEYLR